MTSVSEAVCDHTWSIGRVDTQQAHEQIGTTKYRMDSACPWQPRPQEGYFDIQRAESRMESQTHICEPDRHTNAQGVDDTDDDDIDSDASNACQDHHRLSE